MYRFCQHLKIFQSAYSDRSSKVRVKQRRKSLTDAVLPTKDVDVQMWEEMPEEKLGCSDELGWAPIHHSCADPPRRELGWAPIHHAAQKGAVHIVERALNYNNQLMEQKTVDVAAVTPLLIAVMVKLAFHDADTDFTDAPIV